MKVTLKDVKRIKHLEFELPKEGVWVVTGLNGSGKTSLFAAIYRIKAQHAFQKYYRTNALEDKVDSYADSSIHYSYGGEHVQYRYGGQRWRATPGKNSKLLSKFPYASIAYIEANGARIEPYADELQADGWRLKDASKEIKDFMQAVLDDSKWQKLKYVNTRRGQGNDAYVIPYQKGLKTFFFSEKSFSLGELCVLKLAKKISSAAAGGMLLIDEVEMALHPQAQVRLLNNVRALATDKKLTVLFSTHSATLIKNASRKELIFLKPRGDGSVEVNKGVFPAQILGEIAFDDEMGADFIFYVEDKNAKILAELMCQKYMSIRHEDKSYRPLFRVVPVGGFVQVVEMLLGSSTIFPKQVKRFALLDEDVKVENLVEAKRNGDKILLDLFERANVLVNFLPCTPEVGVVALLEVEAAADAELMNKLCSAFEGHQINIRQIVTSAEYKLLVKAKPRERAKSRFNHIVETIHHKTGSEKNHIKRILFSEYVDHRYGGATGDLMQVLGPMFSAQ
jgi:ABC-type cobalamin/Fe3+-siderophores transport system ATPase subunit